MTYQTDNSGRIQYTPELHENQRKAGRLIRPKGFTQTRKQIKRRYAA